MQQGMVMKNKCRWLKLLKRIIGQASKYRYTRKRNRVAPILSQKFYRLLPEYVYKKLLECVGCEEP